METLPFFTLGVLHHLTHELPQPFQKMGGLLLFSAISALRSVCMCVLSGDSSGHLTPLHLMRGGKLIGLIDLIE